MLSLTCFCNAGDLALYQTDECKTHLPCSSLRFATLWMPYSIITFRTAANIQYNRITIRKIVQVVKQKQGRKYACNINRYRIGVFSGYEKREKTQKNRGFPAKNNSKNFEKTLDIPVCLRYNSKARLWKVGHFAPFSRSCGTAQHAMTREVAASNGRFFRRASPILNRATGIAVRVRFLWGGEVARGLAYLRRGSGTVFQDAYIAPGRLDPTSSGF